MERILIPISPPPSSSPASAKFSCQGANKLEQKVLLTIFYDFFLKGQKTSPVRVLVLGIVTYVRIKYLKQVPFPSDSWVQDELARSYIYTYIYIYI